MPFDFLLHIATIYVTPERRYCDIKFERKIFDLRNVVIIIIIIVARLVVGKCTVCVFDVRWHIGRIRLMNLISDKVRVYI